MALHFSNAKVASGAATSSAVDCREGFPVAIQCPAAVTSATITFTAATLQELQGSNPAFTTYGALQSGQTGSQATVSYDIAANRYIALDPAIFAGVASLKIVTAGNEGADRYFAVVLRTDG